MLSFSMLKSYSKVYALNCSIPLSIIQIILIFVSVSDMFIIITTGIIGTVETYP